MIRVVCTGKGAHREKVFRSFDFTESVTVGRKAGNGGVAWSHEPYNDWCDVTPGSTGRLQALYTFTCRHCGCRREIKAKTLRTALNGLRDTGVLVLDISQLPF